jgi:hypothetical protein
VERANAVLQEHGTPVAAAKRAPASNLDELPVLSDFERSTRSLRAQAQDLLDKFVDVLERLPSTVPLSAASSPPAMAPPTLSLETLETPVLRPAQGGPGAIASTALGLLNETAEPVAVVLRATSLLSQNGDELPARLVSFEPPSFVAPAHGEQPVKVVVRVPDSVRPGTYAGLVQASGLDRTRAVLVLEVP